MKIKDGFTLRKIADCYVVMKLGTELDFNGMITLNETGALIWNALSEGLDKDGIVNIIVKEYDVDTETAMRDTEQFIIKMCEAGVIEQDG